MNFQRQRAEGRDERRIPRTKRKRNSTITSTKQLRRTEVQRRLQEAYLICPLRFLHLSNIVLINAKDVFIIEKKLNTINRTC